MSLRATIELYRAAHGEPEYKYFKKYARWEKFRREPGRHVSAIGDGQEVSRDEYEANIAESKFRYGEAFMSRYPQSYWQYDRKMVKGGWRERLIKDVEMFDDTALSPADRKGEA